MKREVEIARIQDISVASETDVETDVENELSSAPSAPKRRKDSIDDDAILLEKKEKKAYDPSFLVLIYVVLIGDTARGVLWPSLWPLVEELGGTTTSLGWMVATFSIGRIVGSPFFGHLNARWGPMKTLTLSLSIFAVGALIYALGEDSYGVSILGQLVLGLGTANLGVCRGYVADRSHPDERTGNLARLTAVQYAGFAVTPLVGSLISAVQGNTETEYGFITASQSTIPAFILFVLAIIALYVLRRYLVDTGPRKKKEKTPKPQRKEQYTTTLTHSPKRTGSSDTEHSDFEEEIGNVQHADDASVEESVEGPRSEYMLIACLIAINVLTKGGMSFHETLGVQVANILHTSSETAGFVVSIFGACGVATLLSMGRLCKMYHEMKLIAFGLGTMIGCGILVVFALLAGGGAGKGMFFISSFFAYAVAYPISHTGLMGYFSTVVGRIDADQSLWLSYFGVSASLSRIIFPLLAGSLTDHVGGAAAFTVVSVLESSALVLLLWIIKTGRAV